MDISPLSPEMEVLLGVQLSPDGTGTQKAMEQSQLQGADGDLKENFAFKIKVHND